MEGNDDEKTTEPPPAADADAATAAAPTGTTAREQEMVAAMRAFKKKSGICGTSMETERSHKIVVNGLRLVLIHCF
jgi:hypothetical protein